MAEKTEERRDEERQDAEKVESVAKVDATEDEKDAECEMKDKKDADGRSLDDLYAKLEKLIGLIEGSKKDAEPNDEFVPGEPLDAEADKKKDAECAEKDESEEKKKEDEKIGGEKANAELKGERKEEREEKDRKDAAAARAELDELRRKLDAVNAQIRPLSDEERNEISAAQFKADSIENMISGGRAPMPLQGETPVAYRRRAVKRFQSHSNEWKSAKLDSLPDEVFAIAERQIYKDAEQFARTPASMPENGTLREIKERDAAGRLVSKFVGASPKAWMSELF